MHLVFLPLYKNGAEISRLEALPPSARDVIWRQSLHGRDHSVRRRGIRPDAERSRELIVEYRWPLRLVTNEVHTIKYRQTDICLSVSVVCSPPLIFNFIWFSCDSAELTAVCVIMGGMKSARPVSQLSQERFLLEI